MSIFPLETITVSGAIASTVTTLTELPLAKEYAWDFENNDFLLVDGKNVFVTGKEAVKVWIWNVLQVPLGRYKAYTSDYGHQFETLINYNLSKSALTSEAERFLKEALLINPYITGIKNIEVSIDGSKADVSFTADTLYGEVIVNV